MVREKEDHIDNLFGTEGAALLTHNANPRRTSAYHVEFTRRGSAQVDDPTAAVWSAIVYAHHHCAAVENVCDSDHRAKRQCAMGRGKSVWTG